MTPEQIVINRWHAGRFPMAQPELAADAVAALRDAGLLVCSGHHQSTDEEWAEVANKILADPDRLIDEYFHPDGESPR